SPGRFRNALCVGAYAPRRRVPVECGSHVLPPPDSGTVGTVAAETAAKAGDRRDEMKKMQRSMGGAANMAMPAPAAAPPPAQIEAASAAEEATQIAFTAPDKVSVAAGQSLVLPLLDRESPARRLDLYQPALNRQHPPPPT